ncbi:hypothetical protein A6V39_05210 [Candidatus Mycoplasma haematobovis]|uniref:Uncharacterized protein n=1 Tax=Candidatus Mycoplasma haematobovis TaxID=432608 RepID=A0A1A9QBI8_9MOLU|nr:hypothetical protein [Candidatus Mycoplasma haematobovis]OAL09827.1 hypothetical protein A6V39_05210 [Candidatus Mycoplasma haematobovis]
MSKLIPIVAGVTGTAAVATGGSYWLLTQNTKEETKIEINKVFVRNKFQHALIDLTGAGDTLLKEKLKKLKGASVNPNNDKLQVAKTKGGGETDGLAELKDGCRIIYNSEFSDESSNVFGDFKDYCSKNIKDQITATKWAVGDTGFQWKTKHDALKQPKTGITLVAELSTIASEESTDGGKLKAWCTGIENSVFKGPEDDTYKNANEFCTK